MSQGVQSIFKSLATLEKTVEKCHIELEEQKNRLTFTLHCKHGISVFFLSILHQCSVLDISNIFGFKIRNLAIASVLQCNLGCFLAGLLKTHNLSFQDSESLQAVFDKDSCGNVFRCNPRSV